MARRAAYTLTYDSAILAAAAVRYEAHVDRTAGLSECHPWTAALSKGYGVFWDGTHRKLNQARMMAAHRWGYAYRVGHIPDGLWVLHRCDYRRCQNDLHWFLGDALENVTDMVAKGRHRPASGLQNWMYRHGETRTGNKNPAAKLSEAQVCEIRLRYAAGGVTQRALAQEYGVTAMPINRIVRGITWKIAP